MSQISVNGVGVAFGVTAVFKDVSFTIGRGERWGIVGRNGSGKTTLVNVLAGKLEPSAGSVTRAGNLRITLLDQHRDFGEGTSVWDAAAAPFSRLLQLEQALEKHAAAISAAGANVSTDLLNRYDRDLERFDREGGYTFRARVDAVLDGLGFDPVAARATPVKRLSGGELGRVALARQLVDPADVLFLDEPTNHLDLDTTRWLEDYLRTLDATIVLISHDRAFLQSTVDHVLHLEAGTAVAYAGGYNAFLRQHAERVLAAERAYSAQQKRIASEEEYIRRNIAGQNSRQAKGRRKRLDRLERLTPPPTAESVMALRIESASRGGDQVMVARDVDITIEDRVLIRDFNARIMRGEVIGLVGPNGSGKSTLLRAITGEYPVTSGVIEIGSSIELACYRQDLAQVPAARSLFDIIHDLRPQWERGQVQSHLGRFGFSGAAVERHSDSLSGGERARVALAMLVLGRPNFVILDEPTNHLDVESIEALEDALADYDGTILLVSHDRALLRAITTRTWSLENGRIVDYPGNFEEWEQVQQEKRTEAIREAEAAEEQRRVRERADARRRDADTRAARAALRSLRAAAEAAERRVHEIEGRMASLRERLADPTLYENAESVRSAAGLKAELDHLETELLGALEAWTEAADAVSAALQTQREGT